MVGDRCTVCALDQKPRRLGEGLLKMGVGLRDVASFTEWWSVTFGTDKTTKSAWERHKNQGHFQMKEEPKPQIVMDGEPVLDLDDFVDEMWTAWQKANRGKVPDENRLMKWIELRTKIRGDLERKNEEKRMREALAGAAPED